VARPIAVLGGTFDPVHNAHLAIARSALEALGAARVLWVPTGAPAYRRPAVASAAHRLAMLRLAIAGEPRYAVDERELAPGHSGYTVETLRGLRAELGAATELVLLMGADQYAARHRWYRWEEVERLARIAVFARPQAPVPEAAALVVPMAPLAVSASEIRARVARGEDIAGLVPPAVADYIRAHGLYRG